MQKTNLTDRRVQALTAEKTSYVWDANVRNFGVRVSPKGLKTFVVLLDSGRRKSIGRYPHIGLADARKKAERLLAEKTLGYIQPSHTAVSVARERFLEDCAHLKARTQYDYKRYLTLYFDFKGSIGDVDPNDILSRLNKLNDRPSEKYHAFKTARTFFNWCIRSHYIEHHPMRKMRSPASGRPRDRVLTDKELVTIYQTAVGGTTHFHRIIALLILTGQRRGEIAQLRWDWIQDGLVTMPGAYTKNGHEHTFPLCPSAQELIRTLPQFEGTPYLFPASKNRRKGKEATVFNGWSKHVARFKKECGIHDWTLHDLRRTFSTGLAQLGIDQIVTEKLLNHITGSQTPIAAIYNKYQYLDEMREAVSIWEQHLHNLLEKY